MLWMLLWSIIWGAMLLAAAATFIATAMMSDSGIRPLFRLLYYSHILFFPVAILSMVVSWAVFLLEQEVLAHRIILLPLVNLVIFFGTFAFAILFNDGKF